jgi:hypothetical protein
MQRQTRSIRSNKVPWRPRRTPRGNTHQRLFSHWLYCEDPWRSGSTHELPRFSFRLTNCLFYPQLTERLETITRRVGILRTLHCSHQSRLSLLAILESLELMHHWCDAVWSVEMHALFFEEGKYGQSSVKHPPLLGRMSLFHPASS